MTEKIDVKDRIRWCVSGCCLITHPPQMRIARVECRWRVLGFGHVVHDCLERLAYEQGYRVSGLCGELGLCERYFRDMFQRDVGLTPKEWLDWERMVVARRLLVCGVDPLAVSDQLGFSHPNSFRRAFREAHGIPPMRFLDLRREMHVGFDI